MSDKRVRKTFSYRDLTGKTLEEHTQHWEGFSWQAGPVVVTHERAPWGKIQIWAADEAEGRRVIAHAGLIAGVDVDYEEWRWYSHTVQNPRYGRSARMVPRPLKGGGIHVTARGGPNGTPEVAVPI